MNLPQGLLAFIASEFKGPKSTWKLHLWKGDLTFQEAQVGHFPGPGKPSHLVIKTQIGVHIFDYHSVESCFEVDSDGRMRRPLHR